MSLQEIIFPYQHISNSNLTVAVTICISRHHIIPEQTSLSLPNRTWIFSFETTYGNSLCAISHVQINISKVAVVNYSVVIGIAGINIDVAVNVEHGRLAL